MRSLSRLVFMLAVLLMPFGMASASAVAPHRDMIAQMPLRHCTGQETGHALKGGVAECTMACAAALPAAEARGDGPAVAVREHTIPAPGHQLSGLHPETEIPPPRFA